MARPARRQISCVQFLYELSKVLQRRLDRCGALHVDTGIAQQIERIFGSNRTCRNPR